MLITKTNGPAEQKWIDILKPYKARIITYTSPVKTQYRK